MTGEMTFSILVPSIPSRFDRLRGLVDKLVGQAAEFPGVEVLCWMDNKRRSIGHKRQDLVDAAQGEFFAFVDDDDDVPEDYVGTAVEHIRGHADADLFTTDQQCYYNGEPFRVMFTLGAGDDPMRRLPDGRWADLVREPVHCCLWRRAIVAAARFPDIGYHEDTRWAEQARKLVKHTVHIPKVMHVYRYDDLTSEGHDWHG